jgi:exosortase C (VPDSG-CTERM-specific)
MNEPNNTQAQVLTPKDNRTPSNEKELRRLLPAIVAVILCFSQPLYELSRFALQNDLYSHVILVPFISLYLIWIKRSNSSASLPNHKVALSFFGVGTGLLTTSLLGTGFAQEDYLALRILSFLLFVAGVCAWFLGRQTLRTLAFPLAFLIFTVPFPVILRTGLETFLQHGSAVVAYALFKISGTTVFYQDLNFRLPGINLEVAPECSGIRSSLALFITSLLASYFFLRTSWKCALLTLAVIPLALLRNGFRIFTIGELCVHVSPDMINSYIHRQGGPIFFLLSLIPFFFLLRLLFKSESHRNNHPTLPAL